MIIYPQCFCFAEDKQRRTQSGAALLAVLWIIALLIGLVAGASLLLTQDLDSAAAKRQVFRARMVAEMALAIALNPDVMPEDSLLRHQLADDEEYEVQMIGEDGLLNPNALLQREDRETFRRIFKNWGMTLQQADPLIDALLDWVDDDKFRRLKGAEEKEYGMNGMPFNRPFRSIEEMALVRGMDQVEQAYPEWRSWFSVYANPSGILDVYDARPEIVSAVLGVDMLKAQSFRRKRLGRDGLMNTPDDMPRDSSMIINLGIPPGSPQSSLVTFQSETMRMVVRVRVGDLRREISAVKRGPVTGGGGSTQLLWMSESTPPKEDSATRAPQ